MKIMSKNNKKQQKTPQFSYDSIPYEGIYKNGIIKVGSGSYSKSYYLPEVNFVTADEDKQWDIALDFSTFISSFDSSSTVFVTLYNKTQDKEKILEQISVDLSNDNLLEFSKEYNNIMDNKISESNNNLKATAIFTVTINCIDIFEADNIFSNKIDIAVRNYSLSLTDKSAAPINGIARLDILNSIYNMENYHSLLEEREYKGQTIKTFSFEDCIKQGVTTKHFIAPSFIDVQDKQILMNEKTIIKAYYIQNYPSYLRGDFLTDICNIPTNSLVTTVYKIKETKKGITEIREKGTNIRGELINRQKKASHKGYSAELLSPDLQDTNEETKQLLEEITKDDDRVMTLTIGIVLFAESESDMASYEAQLNILASKHQVTVKLLPKQQEMIFNTCLPIGCNQMLTERLITSKTVNSLSPYKIKNIFNPKGKYYGVNAISNNCIVYDRLEGVNPNCAILGMPGAGKSFASKREIINTLLGSPNDEVYIIDPEGEYKPIADALGGSVVKLSQNSNYRINPFDIRLDSADEDAPDPLKTKCSFISTITDIMIGGKYGLSPVEKAIIDRCVMDIYEPHIKHLQDNNLVQDQNTAPTLKDLYAKLEEQPEPEARNLALSLGRFATGTMDSFSYHTNLEVTNRFTVYDIKDIGTGLKELGLQICLDNVWNKMIENMKKGKRTWFYIDEFYLLMQKPSSASYVSKIWKRARKWNGCPCAITQNVEDMLKSEDARTVINNCSFVILLGQAPLNRQQLSKIYGLSPAEQKYINSPKPGTGLIIINNYTIIPMIDEFPNDTKLYKIMSTKPNERIMS